MPSSYVDDVSMFPLVTQTNVYSRADVVGASRPPPVLGFYREDRQQMPHVPRFIHKLTGSIWHLIKPFHRVSFVCFLTNPESRRLQHVQNRIGSCEEG